MSTLSIGPYDASPSCAYVGPEFACVGLTEERCAELGVGIGVSTDAHIGMAIGKLDYARKMLDEIHFPLDLIVTRDRETLLREMAAAGVCDLRNGM